MARMLPQWTAHSSLWVRSAPSRSACSTTAAPVWPSAADGSAPRRPSNMEATAAAAAAHACWMWGSRTAARPVGARAARPTPLVRLLHCSHPERCFSFAWETIANRFASVHAIVHNQIETSGLPTGTQRTEPKGTMPCKLLAAVKRQSPMHVTF